MIFIGIDPGSKGGLAVLNEKKEVLDYTRMPESSDKIAEFLKPYIDNAIIGIEAVHSFTGQGVKSMFTFGRNTGEVIGIIEGLAVYTPYKSFTEISPQKWKNKVIGKVEKIKDEPKEERKQRLKELSIRRCKELFPDVNLIPTARSKVESDGIAESLLIAYYMFLTHK